MEFVIPSMEYITPSMEYITPSIKYLIRPCRPEDLAALVVLCGKHALHERAAYDPAGKEALLSKALFGARRSEGLGDPGSEGLGDPESEGLGDPPKLYCLMVEVGGQVIGYTTYTFDFSTWEARPFLYMDCLYLSAPYRGMGIGKAVMQRLEAEAAKNECVNIQWQTPVFNTDAIGFYRRMGATALEKMRFTQRTSVTESETWPNRNTHD
jgi:ribosomal protein S18 acetylase RimI-like enzyme